MSIMTPYAAHNIVNARLRDEGLDKVIPPQMMYQYAKKGYVDTVLVGGKKRITSEDLQKWLDGYVAKLQGKAAVPEVVEAEADFDGIVGEWTEGHEDEA